MKRRDGLLFSAAGFGFSGFMANLADNLGPGPSALQFWAGGVAMIVGAGALIGFFYSIFEGKP